MGQLQPLKPSVQTQAATYVTSRSAMLNAYVNPNAASTYAAFQYVDPLGRGNVTPFLSIGLAAQVVSIQLTGLRPNSTYQYYGVAFNSYGTTAGLPYSFTTAPEAPVVQTQPATAVTTNSATLQGFVDPNNAPTTAYFEYGVDATNGTTTPLTNCGVQARTITAQLSNLVSSVIYHYRFIAYSAYGTNYGADVSFTIPGPPLLEPLGLTDAGFHFFLHPFGPGTYTVEATSDFLYWDPVATYIDPPDPTEVWDFVGLMLPARFYRAYQAP